MLDKKEYTEKVNKPGKAVPNRILRLGSNHVAYLHTVKVYIELTKPRITWLILMSTAVGYYFGHQGEWSIWAILHTIVGTGLIASGTAALNQWYERDADFRMKRTQARPLPSGRLEPLNALLFGIGVAIVGALELGFGVNWLSSALGVLTLVMYLFVYTPLKQKTWWSTTVGAFPSSIRRRKPWMSSKSLGVIWRPAKAMARTPRSAPT